MPSNLIDDGMPLPTTINRAGFRLRRQTRAGEIYADHEPISAYGTGTGADSELLSGKVSRCDPTDPCHPVS